MADDGRSSGDAGRPSDDGRRTADDRANDGTAGSARAADPASASDPLTDSNREPESDPADEPAPDRGGRPEVVVPMDLYKTVTVFSTLFAVALVVGGMIALDAATARATADAGEVDLPVAFLGVAAIVLGAGTYAFAARFRAEGMGNPKDADDER